MFLLIVFIFIVWYFVFSDDKNIKNSNFDSQDGLNFQKPNFTISDAIFFVKLLAKVARANGKVKLEEARFVSLVLDYIEQDLGTSRHRESLKYYFNEAKYSDETPRTIAIIYRKKQNLNQQICLNILSFLFELACIDGELDKNESLVLREICAGFGFNNMQIQMIFAKFQPKFEYQYGKTYSDFSDFYAKNANKNYQNKGSNSSSNYKNSSVKFDPYSVLGVQKDASFEQIKKAYRAMARRFHPDFLGQGASADEITQSTKKLQEINEAYEILKEKFGR